MVSLLTGCYCFIPEFQELTIITQNNECYRILRRHLNIMPYTHHSYTNSIMLYLRFSQQWGWSLLSCDVTLLSASEECSTSTSSMPANSNSCSWNIPLNSSFLKLGLNWPVFEGYPVLKQQKLTKMAQKITEYSRLLTLQLQWDWGGAQLPEASLKPLISLPMSVIHAFFLITLLLSQITCDTICV